MVPRRLLPLATIALAAFALTGCVLSPPPLAPQAPTTTEPTTAPSSPATSAPETSEPSSPAPSSTDAPASTGSTVTIDGQPVASWGGTIDCLVFGSTALITSSSDDESGSLVGTGSNETGSWAAAGFLLSEGDNAYFQRDETAPATYEGGTFSTEFAATDVTGTAVTVALTTPCS